MFGFKPTPRSHFSLHQWRFNYFVFFGISNKIMNEIWKYSADVKKWTKVSCPLNLGRYGHVSVQVGNQVIIQGGYSVIR